MMAQKKRKHSDEKPPGKRQKKTIEALKSRSIKPVDAKAITAKLTKPGDKIENQNHSLKDLIAKAQEKMQEKRQIGHHNSIASQRIAARLALNQMVKTVDFDDHLKYHTELQQLGCDFIRDQVSCLNKFNLLSRHDYFIHESSSFLEKKKKIIESGKHI